MSKGLNQAGLSMNRSKIPQEPFKNKKSIICKVYRVFDLDKLQRYFPQNA